MESGRISETFQDNKQVKTYDKLSDYFEEVCPYFMSIGVTYRQFWYGNFEICTYALKAEELRRKRVNQEQWWMSIYIRRTLLDVSAAFRDFHKGNKVDVTCTTLEPMPMTDKELQEQKEREQKRKMQEMMDHIINVGLQHNAELHKRKEERNKQVETSDNETKPIETNANEETSSLNKVVSCETSVIQGECDSLYEQLSLFGESEVIVPKGTINKKKER